MRGGPTRTSIVVDEAVVAAVTIEYIPSANMVTLYGSDQGRYACMGLENLLHQLKVPPERIREAADNIENGTVNHETRWP